MKEPTSKPDSPRLGHAAVYPATPAAPNPVTDQGAPSLPASRATAAHILNWLRVLVVLVYPLAVLAGMVWLFARFGPGWGLVAVLALGVLLLFNRPPAGPARPSA